MTLFFVSGYTMNFRAFIEYVSAPINTGALDILTTYTNKQISGYATCSTSGHLLIMFHEYMDNINNYHYVFSP